MSEKNQISIAQEGISFQGDGFLKALVEAIGKYPRNERPSHSASDWQSFSKDLSAVIKKFTGISTNITFINHSNLAVRFDTIDYENVIFINRASGDYSKELVAKLNQASDSFSANLDLKKSFVKGPLADNTYQILINKYMLMDGKGFAFTDAQVMACLIHEVGHIFTGLEMMSRTVATNQVLAELARGLSNEKEFSKREIIIKSAAKQLSLEKTISEEFYQQDDKVVTQYFITAGMKNIRTQSGHSFYDMNTWEMLSDQFTARHGAAKESAEFLSLYYRDYKDLTQISNVGFIFNQIMSFAYGALLAIGGILTLSFAPVCGLFLILIGLLYTTDDHTSFHEPTYDNYRTRILRLRNNYIQVIKQTASGEKTAFTKQYIDSLIKDVEVMDKILEETSEKQSMVSSIKAFFFSNEANRQAVTKFQKSLEEIAHNDLYAKSLALKSI